MNWLDLLIIINILIPSLTGFRNGILRKIFGLAGIVAGFILAVKFYRTLSDFLQKLISVRPSVINIFAFLLILLAIYTIAVYLSKYLSNMNPSVNMINKLAGALAGFVQGLILSSIILFNLNYIGFPNEATKTNSFLYDRVIIVAPFVFDKLVNLLPGNKNIFEEFKRNEQEKDSNNRGR